MELQYYFHILWRRKWLILLTMLLTAALAYLFINYQSSTYKSEAVISTGVVDYTGISSDKNNAFMQQLQVEMRFDNLIEFMSSRQCVNFITFHLVQHDLDALANGSKPFREELNLSQFSKRKLGELSDKLQQQLAANNPTFEVAEDELFFNRVAKALKYDFETLKKDHIKVMRIGKTDYVKIEFESSDPTFAYFGASKFTEAFISYFEQLRKGEDEGTLGYLKKTVLSKRKALEDKQTMIKNYRTKGGIVDLESQKKATVSQIQRLEQERELELSTVLANRKTIVELESLIRNEGQTKAKGVPVAGKTDRVQLNKVIFNLKRSINMYQRQLVDSGGDKKVIRSRLRLTENQLETELKKMASLEEEKDSYLDREDNTVSNNLIDKKVQAKIDQTNAEEKLKLIEEKLQQLSGRAQSYVVNESILNNLEREIDLSNEEYKKLAVELSKEELKSLKGESPLKIIEHAQIPEKPEPNKKYLISAFSGVVGATLATFLVFLMTFLDKGLGSPNQFQSLTQLPLIGNLIKINTQQLNLKNIFNGENTPIKEQKFGELVRNLRFGMEREEGNKVYMITSPRKKDGKSFLIINLAHALAAKSRKVLIIDTNFKENTLSRWAEKASTPNSAIIQSLVNQKLLQHFAFGQLQTPYENLNIDIIKNSGSAPTIMESIIGSNFGAFIDTAKSEYDYILLEGAALNDYSDSKELLEFTDRVIAVFNADSSLQSKDKGSIEFLQSLNGQFMGSVLNKINLKQLS